MQTSRNTFRRPGAAAVPVDVGREVFGMEKRVTGIYLLMLMAGILYTVFAALSLRGHEDGGTGGRGVAVWDGSMEMTREGDDYCYRRILPAENMEGMSIVYHTVHMSMEVFIDGEMVYELKTGEGSAVKTMGFCWNTIPLTEYDAGKEIVFRLTPVYSDSTPKGSFLYGTYQDIEHKVLADRLLQLVLAGAIALAGGVLLLYGFFVVKKGQDAETIKQFAVFAAMLGIWSIGETQVLDWIFPCSIVLVSVSHLMLMAMPIPFMLFLRYMYHDKESKLWSVCCYINCTVVAMRVILQIIGVYDLRETLLLTHVCLLLFVLVVVIMTIREIVRYGFAGNTRINSIGVMVILASTLLELAVYRLGNMSMPLGSMGFLFYVIVMGIVNVRRTRELMEQARENALYRKLAFTDELTGLPNRTAFKEDLEKRMEPDKMVEDGRMQPTVIFMFDLNDLKKCNDTYGHDYGDQYIKMAADVLKELFGQEGKCYRIGGDEFCAWTPYTSLEAVREKLQQLERSVQELNSKGFVVTFSIAAGYAVYEENEDGNGLYSTMKRADAMMYEKKREYKTGACQ